MKFRVMSVAILCCGALVAGCSASTDYEAPAAKSDADADAVPHWIREGVRLARESKGGTVSTSPKGATTTTVAGSSTSLPSREVVVAALAGLGVGADQAGCVYDSVSANPRTASDVATLLAGVSTGTDGAAPSLGALTEESVNGLVASIAPCLDQATMLALLAAGSGVGADDGVAAFASLLSSAQGIDLTKLAGFDPNAIAAAVAGGLGQQQQQQLAALLGAVGKAQTSILTDNPLAKIDIRNLNLSTLTPQEMPLLVLALLQGLTGDQQGQLAALTKVKLDELNINIDPDKLTPDEIGSLLLILSPLLAGAISTTPPTPGPGGTGQVYIPPGEAGHRHQGRLLHLRRAGPAESRHARGVLLARRRLGRSGLDPAHRDQLHRAVPVDRRSGGDRRPRPVDRRRVGAQVAADHTLVGEHVVGRAVRDHRAQLEGDHLVAHRPQQRHVVLDDDERRARLVADADQQWREGLGVALSDTCRRLVEQQHDRIGGEEARELDDATHAG
jgi:hypothetical protein